MYNKLDRLELFERTLVSIKEQYALSGIEFRYAADDRWVCLLFDGATTHAGGGKTMEEAARTATDFLYRAQRMRQLAERILAKEG